MKILMCDDDPDDRNLSKMAFDKLQSNSELNFVQDGQELIALLTSLVNSYQELPDLILLDLNMPVKNGFETLVEIRSNAKLKELNVTVFTTSRSEEDRIESLNRGANNYLVKPHSFNQLIEVFRKICE